MQVLELEDQRHHSFGIDGHQSPLESCSLLEEFDSNAALVLTISKTTFEL
jgi:hypothetical protein